MPAKVAELATPITLTKVQNHDLCQRLAVSITFAGNCSGYNSKKNFSKGSVQVSLRNELDLPAFQVTSAPYVSLICLCGNTKSLSDGMRAHTHIVKNYFSNRSRQNVFTWNITMKSFAEQGQVKVVLRLFEQMLHEGVMPDRVTFISCLSACASQAALAEGMWIHSLIMHRGFEADPVLGTALVSMYAKCGNLDNAQNMFERLSVLSVISWNAIIAAYAQNGQRKKALHLFQHMQLDGAKPNRATFISTLDACVGQAALSDGKQLHAHIMDSGFESDVVMENALVFMYGKCCSLEDAWRMFDKIQVRNVVSWNTTITVYAQSGQGEGVLHLFEQMQQESILPNKVTFVSILSAFASQAALAGGKRIHAHIVGSGFELDTVVGNSLVNMYGKCGSLDSAQRMFDWMPVQNVVSWNAIILIYVQHGLGKKGIELYEQMQGKGVAPNRVTFVNILSACASEGALSVGERVYALIRRHGLLSDQVVATALVNMYGKCHRLEDARRMFNKMQAHDVVPWNAMIAAYAQNGHGKEALDLFNQMQRLGITPDKVTFLRIVDACTTQGALFKGMQIHSLILDLGYESDVVVGTALLDMYGKCGSLVDAFRVFDLLCEQNVISWTAMIAAYVQNGRGREALQLFNQMQSNGLKPNKVSFISIVDACASEVALVEGKQMHADIIAGGFELDVAIGTALVNMYGKCGKAEEARRMFEKMPEKNLVSWNAMIAVCAQNGQGKEALQIFEQMQWKGILPDQATFIGILSACSHAGKVVEGCDCFASMIQDYGITPHVDHYNCMIDLFGRAGNIDEAGALVSSMPHEPTVVSFMALLGACRHQVDVDRGDYAANQVFELDEGKVSPYLVLSSMCQLAGREEDALRGISKMSTEGLKQQPHNSSIEVNGRVIDFLVENVHSRRLEIHAE